MTQTTNAQCLYIEYSSTSVVKLPPNRNEPNLGEEQWFSPYTVSVSTIPPNSTGINARFSP